jgi:hypothetical protein
MDINLEEDDDDMVGPSLDMFQKNENDDERRRKENSIL